MILAKFRGGSKEKADLHLRVNKAERSLEISDKNMSSLRAAYKVNSEKLRVADTKVMQLEKTNRELNRKLSRLGIK